MTLGVVPVLFASVRRVASVNAAIGNDPGLTWRSPPSGKGDTLVAPELDRLARSGFVLPRPVDVERSASNCPRPGRLDRIAPNRRDVQELSVLCLRIQQTSLAYVNTLTLHAVADDHWSQRLTAAGRRGLTRLFWPHVAHTARSGST